MGFSNNADAFVIDMNPLLPDEGIKTHHLMGLLDLTPAAAVSKLHQLTDMGYLKRVNGSTWDKTDDFRSAPLRNRIRSVYELRAKYGWGRMPELDYWARVSFILPDAFTLEQLRDVTKYALSNTALGFMKKVVAAGLAEEPDDGGGWRKTSRRRVTDSDLALGTRGVYPLFWESGVLVTKIPQDPAPTAQEVAVAKTAEAQEELDTLKVEVAELRRAKEEAEFTMAQMYTYYNDKIAAMRKVMMNFLSANEAVRNSEAQKTLNAAFGELAKAAEPVEGVDYSLDWDDGGLTSGAAEAKKVMAAVEKLSGGTFKS